MRKKADGPDQALAQCRGVLIELISALRALKVCLLCGVKGLGS
jgi:hypothetical protein